MPKEGLTFFWTLHIENSASREQPLFMQLCKVLHLLTLIFLQALFAKIVIFQRCVLHFPAKPRINQNDKLYSKHFPVISSQFFLRCKAPYGLPKARARGHGTPDPFISETGLKNLLPCVSHALPTTNWGPSPLVFVMVLPAGRIAPPFSEYGNDLTCHTQSFLSP